MPPPQRRQSPRAGAPPPQEPLSVLVREYEEWRRAQKGKPSRGALKEYWAPRDRRHGQRPEYCLWRQTQCPEAPPERRQNSDELLARALRSGDARTQWAALAVAAAAGGARTQAPRDLPPLTEAPLSCALVRWLYRAQPELGELREVLTKADPAWKPGRAPNLNFLEMEAWLPTSSKKLVRRVAAVAPCLPDATPEWKLTAWMLLRDLRPAGSPPKVEELEALLAAAQAARVAGDHGNAARLTALLVHLLPPQAPGPLLERARVAAWFLAENGLAAPSHVQVSLEDMPFPGEPPASEKGREVARTFRDAADPWHERLNREVETDPEWARLRAAGVVLEHPLAALAWIGKKAHSYAVKKQHDLLKAVATLAARHHCVTTTGKILAQLPADAETVLAYARAIRESARLMPFLRHSPCWLEWIINLRAAWGRLEADAIQEPEAVFFLHETLLDREVTSLRSLPLDLRILALRHLHGRRQPSALVQALEADPRLLRQLEHQRVVELWSVGSLFRERAPEGGAAWVSLVARGDEASGKYSWLVHHAGGQAQKQGRVKEGWQAVWEEIRQACGPAEWLCVAVDASLRLETAIHGWSAGQKVTFLPSWEWAFRVLRESRTEAPPAEVLIPEGLETGAGETLPAPLPVGVLLAGTEPADAATRWLLADGGEPAQVRRSLGIGAHPLIISQGPLRSGELPEDLVRLSLAQATRRVTQASGPVWGLPPAAPASGG